MCGKLPGAERALDWAKFQHETRIDNAKADAKILEIGDLGDFNNHLYTALAELLGITPLSIVKNTEHRNGLEAWRKLHYKYDPQTAAMVNDSCSRIVYTQPVALEKLSQSIEVWENDIRQHIDAGKGMIPESLLCDALIKMCPKDLNETIKLGIDQLVKEDKTISLDKIRAKINQHIRIKLPVG